MRQAAEDAVGPFSDLVGREVFEVEVKPTGERRMDFADRGKFSFARREGRDLGLWMTQQDAHQLERRITRSTKNRDTDHRRNSTCGAAYCSGDSSDSLLRRRLAKRDNGRSDGVRPS